MPQSSAISFAIRTQKKLGLNWLRKVPRLPTIGLPSGLYATAHLYYDLKFLLELEARECEPNGSPIFLHEFLKQTSPLYRRIFELADILDISMEPKFVSRMRFIEEYDPYRKSVLAPIVREELEWLLNEPLQTGMLGTLSDLLRHNFPVYHEVTHAIFNRLVSFSCKGLSTRASNDYFLFIECLVGAQEALVAEQLGGFIGDSLHKANSTYRKVSDGRLARVYKPAWTIS
ncbi:MAG: hypothetical protein HY074_07075 [Deltaproteobacteria bacterium]|nr:hypothetical protein [Deltaproteobacteria bacterium]